MQIIWPPIEYIKQKNMNPYQFEDETDEDEPIARGFRRIRRGSEGYEVKIMSMEDREKLIQHQMNEKDTSAS